MAPSRCILVTLPLLIQQKRIPDIEIPSLPRNCRQNLVSFSQRNHLDLLKLLMLRGSGDEEKFPSTQVSSEKKLSSCVPAGAVAGGCVCSAVIKCWARLYNTSVCVASQNNCSSVTIVIYVANYSAFILVCTVTFSSFACFMACFFCVARL